LIQNLIPALNKEQNLEQRTQGAEQLLTVRNSERLWRNISLEGDSEPLRGLSFAPSAPQAARAIIHKLPAAGRSRDRKGVLNITY
jgi:hypothetical protein